MTPTGCKRAGRSHFSHAYSSLGSDPIHNRFEPLSEPMDDFSNIINLLESAKQLASMNGMPVLAYLIDVAKCEARENKPVLRKRKRGESTAKEDC
ncbi:hypothetical protein YA62_005455 [Agrobacterium sp. LC34]|uniref:Uncharacterized protein n=1 Tax=Agrobacterium tumefaciens TaxID=358 RepID=A0AAE6ELE8_AGRTU|nr:hypothetical protein CFBP6623_05575 [Agrobacterium tumefaciens]QCM01384.1 hypothetical protein CFBP6624_05505 [Agrobacterium tumefaciens]TKT68397.1 hypothetical protein YA62_005455 [Agrobacterium sp. LC34]